MKIDLIHKGIKTPFPDSECEESIHVKIDLIHKGIKTCELDFLFRVSQFGENRPDS